MKPYLKPRAGGVRKLSWFVEGLGRYIQDVNEAKHTDIYIRMEEFCGDHTWQEAAIFIKEQLDQDIPVPVSYTHLDVYKRQMVYLHGL